MPIALDGSQVQVECDRRDYADVILPIFAELGSRAELRVVDDDGRMHAGGGWEAITVLADHAVVAPLLAAAAVAGGIAVGEVVKEMAKDAYKAVKAAIPKCISAAKKQIPSVDDEYFLGIRIYVLPPDLCKPSDRASLDIRLDSSSGESIVLPDGVVDEALWLFEKRLAPLLIRAKDLSPPGGQRMDLHMDRDGEVLSCYITTEFSDGEHFVIHASRDGFHVDEAYVTAKERLPQENPALWSFIQSPPEKS